MATKQIRPSLTTNPSPRAIVTQYCQALPTKSIRRILILPSEIFLQQIKKAASQLEAALKFLSLFPTLEKPFHLFL
jgi:hypothetical protein